MIFNKIMLEQEDYDFVLLFGEEVLNEAQFYQDIKIKKSIGKIMIRNEDSGRSGNKLNHSTSIKVTFDKDNELIPVVFDNKTGEIIIKKGSSLDKIRPCSKVNYIQNFINDNFVYIAQYNKETNPDKLNELQNKIMNNCNGKTYNKHYTLRKED